MSQYSENDIVFLLNYYYQTLSISVDGRNKILIIKYYIENNVIKNFFSTLKMIHNNSKIEIVFTLKWELEKENEEENNNEDN